MTRRSFFRNFGGIIASVAIAQKVVVDIALESMQGLRSIEIVDQYERLPFYLASFQAMPVNWQNIFDKKPWPNYMGNVIKQVSV